MTTYFDTSVLVSLFAGDANTAAAERIVGAVQTVVTSLWAKAEFSSALSLRVRTGRLNPAERDALETAFEDWVAQFAPATVPTAEDFQAARSLVRSVRAPLRAADALHLALCRRLGLEIATLDHTMSLAAQEIGVTVR